MNVVVAVVVTLYLVIVDKRIHIVAASMCVCLCVECVGQLLARWSLGLQVLSLIHTRVVLPGSGWQRCRAGLCSSCSSQF